MPGSYQKVGIHTLCVFDKAGNFTIRVLKVARLTYARQVGSMTKEPKKLHACSYKETAPSHEGRGTECAPDSKD